MKGRVIFVGIHNKPGMQPLDSRTKSGKIIDEVIAELAKCFWQLVLWVLAAIFYSVATILFATISFCLLLIVTLIFHLITYYI